MERASSWGRLLPCLKCNHTGHKGNGRQPRQAQHQRSPAWTSPCGGVEHTAPTAVDQSGATPPPLPHIPWWLRGHRADVISPATVGERVLSAPIDTPADSSPFPHTASERALSHQLPDFNGAAARVPISPPCGPLFRRRRCIFLGSLAVAEIASGRWAGSAWVGQGERPPGGQMDEPSSVPLTIGRVGAC